MKVEYNPINNFKLLKDIPEGECFKKIDCDEILKADSNEIFMKINKTNEDDYDTDDHWKMTFYCVDISTGDLRYMVYDTKVIPVSGKFIIDSAETSDTKSISVFQAPRFISIYVRSSQTHKEAIDEYYINNNKTPVNGDVAFIDFENKYVYLDDWKRLY